jgi:DNA-binding CsgD family transcriptional regulator
MELNASSQAASAELETITERHVAALVAAGCTDASIASRLAVSRESVEWTVAKLCRLLAVGSRDELVGALARSRRHPAG